MPSPTDLCLAVTVAADLAVPVGPSIERCVSAASRAIARLCGRAFELATVTEYPASYGRPFLLLERPPLVAIVSVTEAGELLDPTRYTVVGDLAEGGLVYRLEDAWPDTARAGGLVTTTVELRQGNPAALAVTYTGGYVTPGQVALDPVAGPVTLPADVEEAAILEACALHRGRGRDTEVSAESLGDWSVSYRERAAGQRLASPRAELLLAPYVHPDAFRAAYEEDYQAVRAALWRVRKTCPRARIAVLVLPGHFGRPPRRISPRKSASAPGEVSGSY